MVNLNDPIHSEEAYPNRAANSPPKPFVLWRELIPAYLSPAIMASIGESLPLMKSFSYEL